MSSLVLVAGTSVCLPFVSTLTQMSQLAGAPKCIRLAIIITLGRLLEWRTEGDSYKMDGG